MVSKLAEQSPASKSFRRERGERLVVEAAVRVLVRDGLDGLSVRRVAAEAAVSIGAVQHHFPTKDALLVAAADYVTSEFQIEAQRRSRDAAETGGPTAAFLAFCLLLANATDDDVSPSVVWLWFAAKATQNSPVADAFAAGWSKTEHHLRGVIAELFPHRHADNEAAHLLAVLDGLSIARATEPARMPAARAAHVVQSHLARLAAD